MRSVRMWISRFHAFSAAALAATLAVGCSTESAPEERPIAGLRDGRAIPQPAPSPEPEPEPEPMRINEAGLAIIRESEGLKLSAYELAGQWLIGYGHAATAGPGMTITEEEAEAYLMEDIARIEEGVRAAVSAPLNANQFSALVSLAYNLGIGGFTNSLAYRRLEDGDYQGAADAFVYLSTAVIDGERQRLPALVERRERERALFLEGVGE